MNRLDGAGEKLSHNRSCTREIRGIKQDYIAIELGVSQQTIYKIEQNEEVEDAMLEKIAGVLGGGGWSNKEFQ